ncbi:auxin-responsive protein IAA25-like isoform X2 [Magnolia sinica]|uniref:auxin-responsive protein IAA25-like isoform X2 n=1 Tax=Magnolia sinica TaxID=86752 RepID=UPI00265A7A79|nr:auxin-responsive protein IAA25-like isoform X2 [Magnolia sinica]
MKNPLLTTPPPKEEPEEEESWEKKTTSGFQNHLGPKTRETELRLGFSPNGFDDDVADIKGGLCGAGQNAFVLKQRNDGFGAKRWFAETGSGFGNPWQQEKAVFEPNHHHQREAVGPSPATRAPPVVGWPPVRAFRKNLAPVIKSSEMETRAAAASSIEAAASKKIEDSMFVKVNMEGYAVGRKIDLKAHDSYDSLSRALQKMFDNFFSVNYFKKQVQNEEGKVVTPDQVLIYEDNEGDRMLVGDVPWEMFVNTVKRLYIISGSRAPALAVTSKGSNHERQNQFK